MNLISLKSMPGFFKKYAVHGHCQGMYKMVMTVLVNWFLNVLDTLTWYLSHCMMCVHLIL